MKKLLTVLLVLAMVMSLAACGGGSSGGDTPNETQEWRCAVVTAESHPMTKACQTFAEKVETKTEGRVKINVFYGGQLGSDPETCGQVMDGTLEMAFPSVGNMGSFTDLVYAYQMPFMITDWDQYLELSKSQEAEDLLNAISDKLGVKAIATWNSGFRHLLNVDKPLQSVSDCNGNKFRVGENEMMVSMFKALGASPTVIPYGEIYTSLQNKVIDGLEMDISAIYMEKHFEVAKYLTMTKHFTWPGIALINEDVWNSLSDEDKAAIEEAAVETLDENIAYIGTIEEETTKNLLDEGVQITEMSDSMYQEFVAAEKDVIETYTQDATVKAYYDKAVSLQN